MNEILNRELAHFQSFFSRMGFKRIDGAVYGLLVLSETPLRSDEIEHKLNLSQSAVSISLKNLSSIGAIESTIDPKEKRVKLHSAKEDALSVVASVFRKREQEYIYEFKAMAKRLKDNSELQDQKTVAKRLDSIIQTCETAEAVMNFVIKITRDKLPGESLALAKKIPEALRFIELGTDPAKKITTHMTKSLATKLMGGLDRIEKNLENYRYEK